VHRFAPALALLLIFPLASGGVPEAVSSLRAQQGADGGWGSRPATDWVMIGLAAAGEDVSAWGVDDYLLTHPPDATSLLAWERATLALACAGKDASSAALVVKLGFVGAQYGNPSALNDDAWAILSLRASGTPADDANLRSSATYLLAGENAQGGWGWSVGGLPDPDDTGAALMALAASEHPLRGPGVARGVAYLRGTQAADGGWGISPGAPSNVLSTAWATMGLLASGEDPATWTSATGATPITALAAMQQADGSFAYTISGSGPQGPVNAGTAIVPLLGKTYVCNA